SLSAYVRQSARPDLANPGTYQIELWDSTDVSANKIVLGSLQPDITNSAAWELHTLTFGAPAQAANYRVLAFRVIKFSGPFVYPAIDNVSLVGPGGDVCTTAGTSVVIDRCDTGVPNAATSNSCVAGVLQTCTAATDHGGYVGCI